jgi:hypothetical protein
MGLGDGLSPQWQSTFFTNVDGLPCTDQRDDHTPLRNALAELDEMIRFRPADRLLVYVRDSLCIVRSLCFIKHNQVFGRHWTAWPAVRVDVVLDGLNKRLATATCVLQRILKHLHERPIAR